VFLYSIICPLRDLVICEQLLIRVNKSNDDVSRFQFFSYEMTIHLNLFGPIMKDEIRNNVYCCLVVTYKVHLGNFFRFKPLEELF